MYVTIAHVTVNVYARYSCIYARCVESYYVIYVHTLLYISIAHVYMHAVCHIILCVYRAKEGDAGFDDYTGDIDEEEEGQNYDPSDENQPPQQHAVDDEEEEVDDNGQPKQSRSYITSIAEQLQDTLLQTNDSGTGTSLANKSVESSQNSLFSTGIYTNIFILCTILYLLYTLHVYYIIYR